VATENNKLTEVVTVTQTIKHVLPTTRTITTTKDDGSTVIKTDETTVISTEVVTVTAAPTPTTVVSVSTLDQPVTVTATVTEEGREVLKTTEVFTQVVTVTSEVIQQTLLSTTTEPAVASFTTNSVSTTTTSITVSSTGSASNSTDDPQTSLTLDERVIMTALFNDGDPSDGETPSLTSVNNFINFCKTQNVPVTNGEQLKNGSCNPVPMGRILATDKMPSSVFVFPLNFGTIPANETFTIQMKIGNLVTGNFVNADDNYYAAPAQVDSTGTLIGHSHVTIEDLLEFNQTEPTNPLNFKFFKGLNDVAVNGILTANVTGGLPPGKYRIASINAAANHQPALVSVAQHGTLDAFAYFSVE